MVETIRSLPPDSADHLRVWIKRLGELSEGKGVDWSDSWSEEDIEDLQAASIKDFEARELEDH